MAQIKEHFAVVRGYKNSVKISSNNAEIVDSAAHLIDDLESICTFEDCIGDLFALLTAAGCVITVVASDKVEEVL